MLMCLRVWTKKQCHVALPSLPQEISRVRFDQNKLKKVSRKSLQWHSPMLKGKMLVYSTMWWQQSSWRIYMNFSIHRRRHSSISSRTAWWRRGLLLMPVGSHGQPSTLYVICIDRIKCTLLAVLLNYTSVLCSVCTHLSTLLWELVFSQRVYPNFRLCTLFASPCWSIAQRWVRRWFLCFPSRWPALRPLQLGLLWKVWHP